MEKDETFDPVHVGLLGAQAEMLTPDRIPDLVKQSEWFGCWRRAPRLRVVGVTHFAIRKTSSNNAFPDITC